MKKNENIDEQSIELIKDYHTKRIKQNICLHKVCLIMLVIINIGLLVFAILYKKQISDIRTMSSKNSTNFEVYEDLISQKRKLIDKKVLNILANNFNGKVHFSYLIDNSDDFLFIKNLIIEFYKDKGKNYDIDKVTCIFLYQQYIDGVMFENVIDNIEYFDNIVVLFRNSKGRFGVYFKEPIELNDKYSYKSDDDNCFLFSFDTKKMYKYIGKEYSVKSSKDKIFDFGNGDIILPSNFSQVSSQINFPFKSFDVSTINDNPFCEENGDNYVYDVEIFSFQLVKMK